MFTFNEKREVEKIRGLLLANAGLTIPMVAKEFNVSRQFAYLAIQGKRNSIKAKEIFAYIKSQSLIE